MSANKEEMHEDLMPDAPYHFAHMHWQMNTLVKASLPSGMPVSLNSLPGEVKRLQNDLFSTLRSTLSWHGLQDLPSFCTNYSGHSDKSRGRWRSTCVWNSLNFITNHRGLSLGQALWLLHSHALISGWSSSIHYHQWVLRGVIQAQ